MALGAGNDLGQGFLTDYSGMAGAGAAFQGFASAYKDAQDQQMKRQELQSKIMAQQQQMSRDATEQALKMKVAGLRQGPGGPTDLQPGPLDPNSAQENMIKASAAGVTPTGQDQYGNPTGYAFDPNSARGMGFDIQKQKNDAIMEMTKQRMDIQDQRMKLMQERLEKQQSQQGEQTMDKDPVLTQFMPRVAGAKKILNLMDNAEKGGPDDVKSNQALLSQVNNEIARLETGSQSPGLQAGEKTEMGDARAKLLNLKDTLLGGVTSVNLHEKFQQGRALVRDLGNSYLGAVSDRHDYLSAGVNDPDKQRVMKGKIDFFNKRYQGAFDAPGPQEAPPPGLVAPGLVKQLARLFGGGQAAPAQQFTPDVVKYATAHGITPQAAQAVKDKRLKGGQ